MAATDQDLTSQDNQKCKLRGSQASEGEIIYKHDQNQMFLKFASSTVSHMGPGPFYHYPVPACETTTLLSIISKEGLLTFQRQGKVWTWLLELQQVLKEEIKNQVSPKEKQNTFSILYLFTETPPPPPSRLGLGTGVICCPMKLDLSRKRGRWRGLQGE